jgi:RimJ/RimL family protein N-acetyltransferase
MLDAYQRHPDAFTSTVEERRDLPLDWWARRLGDGADSQEVVFGAWHGDELVGAAGLSLQTRQKSCHKATLFGMVVAPSHGGRGLGTRLVEAVLQHARDRPQLLLVQLTVSRGNDAALALYRRFGFVEFGMEPLATASEHGFVDKIHLWCHLRPAGAQ